MGQVDFKKKSSPATHLFLSDDVSIWNKSIDIDPDGTDEPVSSRTRSPHKPTTSRSVTEQQISCTAHLFLLDDVSIWNQSIDIDPNGTEEPVSSRTRSPHKSGTSRSVTGQQISCTAHLFVLDDVSIWNQSIDIDPDGTDEPVSSRTRSPHKPGTSRSVTGQQISCTAHLFVLDDVSIWNQSIDIDPNGTEEPVSSRTRSPHKPSTSRSVTGQQISCTAHLFLLDDVSIWNQSIDIDPDGTDEPVSSRTRSPHKPSTSRSVTGQQISCTAHLFLLDDVSIWNQSIDIDPDGTDEPVSSRTRSPHKPSTSRSVTEQQISCTAHLFVLDDLSIWNQSIDIDPDGTEEPVSSRTRSPHKPSTSRSVTGQQISCTAHLFLLDDVSIWNQSIDIDPDGTDEPVSSRTRSPHKPTTSRSVTGQQISCTAHLFLLDDVSIWNQSIDIDPDGTDEPVSSRTRSPHKPGTSRSVTGQQISCTAHLFLLDDVSIWNQSIDIDPNGTDEPVSSRTRSPHKPGTSRSVTGQQISCTAHLFLLDDVSIWNQSIDIDPNGTEEPVSSRTRSPHKPSTSRSVTGQQISCTAHLFLLDDVSIWNQSIDIDPNGTDEPVSSRTRSPHKPSTSRSVTGQQISCTAHLFVLDDVSIWNQSIDIDPDGTDEPVSSRTRSPHKPGTSRSVTGQQNSCTSPFVCFR